MYRCHGSRLGQSRVLRDGYDGTTTYSSLTADLDVDVAVIGGGVAGLCTAWEVAQAGRRAVVFEADRIVASTTEAVRTGLPASLVTGSGLPFPIAAAIRVEDQAQFHTLVASCSPWPKIWSQPEV